jgi:hypothetical protein
LHFRDFANWLFERKHQRKPLTRGVRAVDGFGGLAL